MRAPASHDSRPLTGQVLIALLLLWLSGAGIRVPILDIPPVLPVIRDSFGMSETQVGLLTGLPLGMFALAAVPGALLVARLGAVRTLALGLLVTALAGAGRGAMTDVWTLYAATLVMAFGISVVQPALPQLVGDWLPDHIGLGTAVTTNGYLIGSSATTGLSLPLIVPLLGGSWRLDIAAWGIPTLIAAVMVTVLAPRDHAIRFGPLAGARKWMPDWKSPLVWMLGLTLGANTGVFFGCNAFIPEHLHAIGRPDLVSPALFWLNFVQLMSSFVLLLVADRLQRSIWSFLGFGPVAFVGLLGVMFAQGYWIVVSGALVGIGLAVTFVVILAQPPVLSPPNDVHRVSAGALTIGYSIGIVVPVISGALWDATGISRMAFVPFLVMMLMLATAGVKLMGFPVARR